MPPPLPLEVSKPAERTPEDGEESDYADEGAGGEEAVAGAASSGDQAEEAPTAAERLPISERLQASAGEDEFFDEAPGGSAEAQGEESGIRGGYEDAEGGGADESTESVQEGDGNTVSSEGVEQQNESRRALRRTLMRVLASSTRWSVDMLTNPRAATAKLERTTGTRVLSGAEFEVLREYFGRGERFRDVLRVIGKRHLGIARLTNNEQILFWRARIALRPDDQNAKRALTRLYRGRKNADAATPAEKRDARSERGNKPESSQKGPDIKKFLKMLKTEDLRTLGIISADEANTLIRLKQKSTRRNAVLSEEERRFVAKIIEKRQRYLSPKGRSSKKTSRKKKR